MNQLLVVSAIFASLLALEWRYRLRSARLIAVILALMVLSFMRPDPTANMRQALSAPQEERVTERFGYPISEYESGVRTMTVALEDAYNSGAGLTWIAKGVLVWLACSPLLLSKQQTAISESRSDLDLARKGSNR